MEQKNIFGGKSIFIWNVPGVLSGDPTKIALWLIAHGFVSAMVKCADGAFIFYPSWSAFPNWLTSLFKLGRANVDKNFVDVLHSYGLLVFGWGFNYGRDPEGEGRVAAQQCNDLGLDGWIVDIEGEFESRNTAIGDAGKFIGKFRQYIIKRVPLAYCGWAEFWSPTGSKWHNFELASFFMNLPEFICGIPMFYWDSYDANGKPIPTSPARVQSELRGILKQWATVTEKPISPAGRAYTGDGGLATPESIVSFATLAKELCQGVTYWVADQAVKVVSISDALANTPGWGISTTPVPQPIPDTIPILAPYTGTVNSDITLGLNVRSVPVIGSILGKLYGDTSFEANELVTASDGHQWLHLTKPISGWVASWLTKYVENDTRPAPEKRPAIPGPFTLLSDAEITGDQTKAFDERFPGAKLDAYPATINLEETWIGQDGKRTFGKGVIAYSISWMSSLKKKMTERQWHWFWVDDAGIHNGTDKVQQVTTAHNRIWVLREDSKYFYVQSYSNDEPAPDLLAGIDPYRIHYVTIMHRTLNKLTGGIFYPDCGKTPYPLIVEESGRELRVEKKYAKSLTSLPMDVTVKVGSDQLNVRDVPHVAGSKVLTKISNGTSVTIFEFRKMPDGIWAKITSPGSIDGWIATWFTDWSVK